MSCVKGGAHWCSLINVNFFQVSVGRMALWHAAHVSSMSGKVIEEP